MSIQHRLATPVIQPRMRFFDTDGKPLVGGKVYAFKVGTEEFKPTYRNSELTALNTNPVILDGAGSALIYLRGANLLKIYDRHGNFIEERIEYQQRERAQFYDDYGRPLKNGYVYTYDYQSTIRKTSYSIDDVINPNPIVLDENGTALVNIVGAYRLRQYNSKNVFVGDQDFKRPPIKALTSVVYPVYHKDQLSINSSISDQIDHYQITWQETNLTNATTMLVAIEAIELRDNTPYASTETARVAVAIESILCDVAYQLIENISPSVVIEQIVQTERLITNISENTGVSIQIIEILQD